MEGAALECVSVPGAACHKGFEEADIDTLHAVFAEAIEVLEEHDVPYVEIGGLASAALGRPRASADIDILVTPQDARGALVALGDAEFATDEINPHWLFKAVKDGVLVDLLFKMKGDIYLDAEMLERATTKPVLGTAARVIPAEDLIVVKALAHDEESTRHWFDALGVVAAGALDWDYLVRRAAKGPRRVLSLLLYATSLDLVVPARVIRAIHDFAFGEDEGDRGPARP
jgi:predicted nucleotidyltransferase